MTNQEKVGFFESATPKVMFFFGITLGIALMFVVNYLVAFSNVGAGGLRIGVGKTAYSDVAPPAPPSNVPDNPGNQPPAEPVRGLSKDDHVRGNKNAKVVMIEYSDFECPFCGRHHPTMNALLEQYPNDVAWVYRHFPLSFHPTARPAAEASECFAEQGKFWEFADKAFENQTGLTGAFFEQVAKDLKLNSNKFKDCVTAKKYAARVNNDESEGGRFGVNGTPATFINGQLVSGAMPIENLKQIIDAELKK